MITLGIETSCDDTSLAFLENGSKVLAMVSQDQEEFHIKYGGVVPEIASRIHLDVINPLYVELLGKSGIQTRDINLVSVTYGPGLLGSLLIGMTFAKTLCLVYDIPLVGVNHLVGHLYAPTLSDVNIEYPNISLIVSGGHTELLLVNSPEEIKLLGASRDDAAGEVFDKLGRTLGLGFPAGARLDKLARTGNPKAIELPRPMVNSDDLDFSFSGLKTAGVHYLNRTNPQDLNKADFVASLEAAVVDVLVAKLKKAVSITGVHALNIAGGVSANTLLRRELTKWCDRDSIKLTIPPLAYCMDNGAMIAIAGWHRYNLGFRDDMTLDCVAVIDWE
jgi:N6-L-threonylcarbamoyladenine synthase